MADHLVKEDAGLILLEGGSGSLLLEVQSAPSTGVYLVQEADGTSKFTLENGSGFILLEQASTPAPTPTGGSFAINVRRPVRLLFVDDDDELIALTLAVRAIRRRRLS